MTVQGPRRWSELTGPEAREVFDTYVSTHPDRLAEFFDEVKGRDGPVVALDFSRESLRVLWPWVMATVVPRATNDYEMRISDPPWWYDFHPQLGQRIGPDLARLVTLIAAYVAETIMRRRPGSSWVLDRDPKAADFNQPLLRVEGKGEFLPDLVLVVFANQWANGVIVRPDRLAELYDLRAGPDSGSPAGQATNPAEKGPPYVVERGADGSFETVISFDEVVAHESGRRIDRLVEALEREPGIERAVHEDREFALVRAPSLDDRALRATVDRVWEQLVARH